MRGRWRRRGRRGRRRWRAGGGHRLVVRSRSHRWWPPSDVLVYRCAWYGGCGDESFVCVVFIIIFPPFTFLSSFFFYFVLSSCVHLHGAV